MTLSEKKRKEVWGKKFNPAVKGGIGFIVGGLFASKWIYESSEGTLGILIIGLIIIIYGCVTYKNYS